MRWVLYCALATSFAANAIAVALSCKYFNADSDYSVAGVIGASLIAASACYTFIHVFTLMLEWVVSCELSDDNGRGLNWFWLRMYGVFAVMSLAGAGCLMGGFCSAAGIAGKVFAIVATLVAVGAASVITWISEIRERWRDRMLCGWCRRESYAPLHS